MNNNEDFTTAARAETPPICEHHWVSHGTGSSLLPWIIRCGLCGHFDVASMESDVRDFLAAKRPADAEVLAALNAYEWVFWRDEPETDLAAFIGDRVPAMRAALTAAREARP